MKVFSPTPKAVRVEDAARSLQQAAGGFRFAAIPALAITALVILLVSRDRSTLLVILAALTGIVAAQVLASVLDGLSALLRINAELAETSTRLDRRLADGLEQIALALETLKAAPPAGPTPVELRATHLAEIRQAIRVGLWDQARTLVEAFADTHPGDSEASHLFEELAEARKAATGERLARIEAAREANDPDRVIDLRDEVKSLLDAERLQALDRDLAKWLMMSIHRRLRAGTVRVDVATLAGRVAATFDATPEGAGLRASLPTLRRAAGLCARCAQPYTGIDDACPACLTGVSSPTSITASAPADLEPVEAPEPP